MDKGLMFFVMEEAVRNERLRMLAEEIAYRLRQGEEVALDKGMFEKYSITDPDQGDIHKLEELVEEVMA